MLSNNVFMHMDTYYVFKLLKMNTIAIPVALNI